MTDEQRLQMVTDQLILVRDNLFRGMSKSIQKLQARSINEVLELPSHTESPPAQQEPVVKPYAYEYGRNNGDGTYSVVIEKGDLVQTAPAVYNYVRPRNAHKDWPIKELFDHPPAQRTWVGLTDEERQACINYRAVEAKLKEKNT